MAKATASIATKLIQIFFRNPDRADGRALSRATALRVGLLFGPTAFLLTLLRLTEHSLLNTTGARALGELFWNMAPPPFLTVLLTLALGWLAHRAWPYVRPVWLVAGTLILGVGLMLWAVFLVPPWLGGWMTAEAFQVLRWDLLALLGLALTAALLLERLWGWPRTALLAALHTLIPLLLLLPIFEVGCIRVMGSPLEWSLLAYVLRNLGENLPVLASEVGAAEVVLLLLPLAITLLPPALERLPALRRWLRAAPAPAPGRSWQMALAALPPALLLALAPAATLPPTHRTISYAGMARSMLADPSWEPEGFESLAASHTLPFDMENLRLVPTDSTRRLNVVVVILESFRSRSTTPYNPALATTPFLDELARRSLLVEHMYGIVSYTNKSLAPILAGVYPELSREIVEAEAGAVPGVGLPALLRPLGYRSAFFTPATMLFERKDRILKNLGFDEIRGDASYAKDGFHVANYFGYEDRIMLAPSLQWVDEVTATGQPFFLSYLTLTAHHPYKTPLAFPRQPFAPNDSALNDYLNALHYTDAFLKALFEGFEARGLVDSTLFILLSDHGEAFGEHGLITHGDVIWDEALHTPALLFNPVLFPEGGRITGNRQHTDVLPTVADALGLRLEGGAYPGRSLLRPVPDDRLLYHSARDGNMVMALRQDSLKFFYYNRRQPMQVFDVRNDPLERRDIAEQISPDRLKSAELSLLLWRKSVQQIYHDRQTELLAAR